MSNHDLKKDQTNRNLGFKAHQCRICGEKGNFISWSVREMFYGSRDEFEYFACLKCECLQIAEVPQDLGLYYTENYYSFVQDVILDNKAISYTKSGKILDVGCGSGKWLVEKYNEGYRDLWGCDPFIGMDLHYEENIHIRKCTIHEMLDDDCFDYIHMGDSLEHVLDPIEVLRSAKRLLKSSGEIEITIPTWPNAAFDLFGTHWFQIDAPRHIFIPSIKCMQYMAEEAGLEIVHTVYDSKESQFFSSFFYQHNISLVEQTDELVREFFSVEQIKEVRKMVLTVNKEGQGDHMIIKMRQKI